MAYLVAKRVYQGEAVPLLYSRMPYPRAALKMAEIRRFPGVLALHDGNGEGELWFEVERDNGDLAIDPVCFPPALARETLLRTGAQDVDWLLSPEYAQEYLTSLQAAK